ncbi:MAG: Gfo/Idh/MocA family oxidoreductase [Pseudomonadota bacterium]
MIVVAIVGAGIGRSHLAGYRRLPDMFSVRALCDLDTERAKKVVGLTKITVTDDLEAVLADPDIDLIDICLPPHLHADVSIRALGAGKHVICEKPLACSLAEVDQIEKAAAAAEKSVFPVFQYRYGPGLARLRHLIASGIAGKPLVASLETHWNRGGDYYAIPWRGTWAGEKGGAILSHAIHAHDLLCQIFGPVERVEAMLATRVNPIETEDCAAIALRHACGALATSSITLGAAADTSRLRFVFEGLTAESGRSAYEPAADIWTFTARAPIRQAAIDAALTATPDTAVGFQGYLDAVHAALSGNPGREVTLADGRHSIALATAIYDSARQERAVSLPLHADHPLYASWLPDRTGPGASR